jgi:hypothetical protein
VSQASRATLRARCAIGAPASVRLWVLAQSVDAEPQLADSRQGGEDIGAMVGLIDHALALNPSYARGWYVSGILRWFSGQAAIAIEHVEASMRLSLAQPGRADRNGRQCDRCRAFLSRRFE